MNDKYNLDTHKLKYHYGEINELLTKGKLNEIQTSKKGL